MSTQEFLPIKEGKVREVYDIGEKASLSQRQTESQHLTTF